MVLFLYSVCRVEPSLYRHQGHMPYCVRIIHVLVYIKRADRKNFTDTELSVKLASTSLVLKVNDNIWEYVTWDIEKCPLCVLTGVRIKRVNFREN